MSLHWDEPADCHTYNGIGRQVEFLSKPIGIAWDFVGIDFYCIVYEGAGLFGDAGLQQGLAILPGYGNVQIQAAVGHQFQGCVNSSSYRIFAMFVCIPTVDG